MLGALWLLAGLRWLSDASWPASVGSVTSEARACALGTVLAVLWTSVHKTAEPKLSKVVALTLLGAALFTGRAAGVVMHGIAGDEYNRAAALCLVPIVVLVALQAVRNGARAPWWPGLAGLAGALLIFPLATGIDAAGLAGLVLPVVLMGVACVVAEREAEGLACAWAVASLLGGGASGLGMLHWVFLRGNAMEATQPVWQPLLFDLPIAVMTAAALVMVGARRYSASYFAITLLTLAGGAAVMRPGWSWRLVVGLALLTAGTVGLLRRIEADTSGLGLAG